MRRVELFELIRHDFYVFKKSRREIARKRGIHRRVVRQAIEDSVPPERKKPVRSCPVLTAKVKGFVDQILLEDKKAPRKQRHTARRIWMRVRDELGSKAAESTVRRYVAKRRKELGIGTQVFILQHHQPGHQGEADFYEADFDFPWGRETAQVMVLRSEFSAGALHVAFPRQTQSAMFEAIERALHFMGGGFEKIRFDNLPLAVAKVLKGGRRIEQDRFIAFRSHLLFEASFTTLGIEGAHEKGGVEGEVGRFRRRWLTPVPQVQNWEQANDYLEACCIKDLDRIPDGHPMTVGEAMVQEASVLRALPEERFEIAELNEVRVDDKATVAVKRNHYSVPCSLSGRMVATRVSPFAVEVWHDQRLVATHERSYQHNAKFLLLDHYLEVLVEKPGALPGSLALHQARLNGDFPASYDRLWTRFRAAFGDRTGTHAMIDVLLLHRSHPKQVVHLAVEQTLDSGASDPGAVALFARHMAEGQIKQLSFDSLEVGELGRFDRPLPETSAYDLLVGSCR